MRKKILAILLLSSIAFLMTACTKQIMYEIKTNNQIETTKNMFIEENSEKLDESLTAYYYYDRLIANEKELYCILYNNMTAYHKEIYIPEYIEYDVIDRIFKYVMYDHPEIFWISGYDIIEVNSNIILYPTMTMDVEDIKYLKEECDLFIKNLFRKIDKTKTEYEISKSIYEHLVTTIEYADDANAQNMLSAMLNKRGVCTGFTKLYQYILNQYGIEAVAVTGLTKNGTSHMWNMVKIEDDYYYTDLTYGAVNSSDSVINYDYFNVTSEQIANIYEFEAGQILYNCTATDANYYSQTGNIYHFIDKLSLKNSFSSELPITIKCSNKTCYTDMINYLIKEKHIYDYLPNQKLHYQTIDETMKIIFYE